jgi:hypothetical protein
VYYGSRVAQPARVRAFIDLAVQRLTGNRDYFLEAGELVQTKARRRRTAESATLLDDARRGLEDVAAGRVRDADIAIAEIQRRRASDGKVIRKRR